MTQADSLDLGFPFPDTHREIRALTATGMDEAQAEAVVYASIRASRSEIKGVRRELEAKLANRLLTLGLGLAALILGAASAVIAVVLNAD